MNISKKSTYIPNNGNLRIPSREEFHKSFSGVIYQSDFNQYIPLTTMASRIASNLRFNETCKRYRESQKNTNESVVD